MSTSVNSSRRKFVVSLGLGGAATVAAVTSSIVPFASSNKNPTDQVVPVAKGYRLTAHIQDYYRSAML